MSGPAPDVPRYPLFLDLSGRDVLVVGGGPVAARRAAGLVEAGARVRVIAPQLCEDLAELAFAGDVIWSPREASAQDVTDGPRHAPAGSPPSRRGEPPHGLAAAPPTLVEPPDDAPAGPPSGLPVAARWWLVQTATGDHDVDSAVAAEADRLGIWCVRADRAGESAAHVPALATGPDGVQIAVSGGGDPGRARAIRNAISDLLASGRLPLRRVRGRAPSHSPTSPNAIQVSGRSATSNLDETTEPRRELGSDRRGPAERVGEAAGATGGDAASVGAGSGQGRVVLVGGGPGDPGLITVAGRQWLARADVVITDRLGPTSVLAELDPDVQVIDVGKTAGHHPIPQDRINDLLVEHAQLGRTVVRLKGGDPFVLGRGGEEALHCVANDVPVEVIPGVTSAISVPAAAGIPVTHRGITSSMVVASAHAGAGNALAAARSAPPDATLVLLMGLSGLLDTARELVEAGRPATTPVAVISDGWSPRQRTVTGTLATIAGDVGLAQLPGPVVIVVGEVVRLRTELRQLDRRVETHDLAARATIAR